MLDIARHGRQHFRPMGRGAVLPCTPRPLFLTVCLLALLAVLTPSVFAADLTDCRDHLRRGEYHQAIRMADQVIEDRTWIEEWYLLKARAHWEIGEDAQALATVESAQSRFALSIRLRMFAYELYKATGRDPEANIALNTINRLIINTPWRYNDPDDLVVQGKAALIFGADPRQVLEILYDQAIKRDPRCRSAYLATGQLALDKNDFAEAAQAFERGLRLFNDDPDMLFGLAQAYAESDGRRVEAALASLLAVNPNHIGALLMQADHLINGERYEHADELIEQAVMVNPRHPIAWVYRAVMAHLASDVIGEHAYMDFALRRWDRNPDVYHTLGRKLSQKYRFAEGAALQRQALELDGDYLPAKKQLAQDLLRLGEVDEGWELVRQSHNDDGYDVVVYNLVTLADRMAQFRTIRDDDFILRMSAREADVYGDRVLALLHRAKTALGEKYGLELDEPVTVEIFPDQKDFAIRTFGLPGGSGYLGVCFGKVVTANSPAAMGANPTNWESVLWHEYCHVVTLSITRNRMPRWLSEGISVYEEKQADGTWGESMTVAYRRLIEAGELTPISRLSAAFLRPRSPLHLQFAYYESSLVVEFMIDRFGLEKLRAVLRDLGDGLYINQAIENHMGPLDQIDADFEQFVKQRADALAKDAQWENEDFTPAVRRDSAALAKWVEDHPNHYPGLRAYAEMLMREQLWAAATRMLERAIELHPTETGPNSAYILLAAVQRKLGETDAERRTLEKLATLDASAAEAFARLIELASAAEDWPAVYKYAQRMLAVNPLVPLPYRHLAKAAEYLGDDDTAINACRKLIVLDPPDPAAVHFSLARLLHSKGDAEAKRHVLIALEEAPRYREAHRLLLEMVEREKAAKAPEPREAEADAPAPSPEKAATPGCMIDAAPVLAPVPAR